MSRPPMQVVSVDLARLADWSGLASQPAQILFWWRDLPLGSRGFEVAELPPSRAILHQLAADLGAEQLAARDQWLGRMPTALDDARIVKHARPTIGIDAADVLKRLDRLGQPSAHGGGDVTLIICTRDRLDELPDCLDCIGRLDPAPAKVVIVDNSADGNARPLVAAGNSRLVYVHEPRPGLSHARNAGLRVATTDVIAFTDDDARPAPGWVGELARAFADWDVGAVSGLVLPAELASEAQQIFQFTFGGFGDGFLPVMYDASFFEAARPHGAQVWRIGAGANMAFRRAALERVGLFDERLGAGASGCSEDSEMWYRLLAAGERCLYEPRAVVFHHHRRDLAGLRRQLRAYMRGHVAALVAQNDRYGDRGNQRRIFLQLPKYLVGTMARSLLEWHPQRFKLALDEAWGWLAGLVYLARWRWRSQTVIPRFEDKAHG